MKLKYTPQAIDDLQEIRQYIRYELHNPQAAERLMKTILDACSHLKNFPLMGSSLSAKTGYETDLRILLCAGHIAVYHVQETTVSIARIFSSKQDYIHLLFGELEE